jgi:hypothetical protein
VKPEETSDSDKLAQQIETLRGQILASEKRALAVEFKVPEAMLTATDADGMRSRPPPSSSSRRPPTTPPPRTPPHPRRPRSSRTPARARATHPDTRGAGPAEYEKYYPSPLRR